MIVVRAATAADAAGMARAWLDAGRCYAALDPETFRVPDAEGLEESLAGMPVGSHETLLVAELDGDVAGWVGARIESPVADARHQLLRELAGPRVVTDALVVTEPARGRGVGAALMAAVHRWAVERGARVAVVDTYVDSPLSVPFYERLGYRRRSLSFRLPLEPA